MAARNDSTIDRLARTICACVQHEVPYNAVHDHVQEIVKLAEARAEDFLQEDTGDELKTGPAKERYDDLQSAAWALNRLLNEFPARALHDASFTIDPETMEDLCRASAALSAANTLIAKASRREGSRGGDAT